MEYDIAAKVALDTSKEEILRRYLSIEPKDIEILEELPQETVSLKRSDFPLRVRTKEGVELIVLIEIQTVFERRFVFRLIDYTVRFMLKYDLEVIPLVLLLTPSEQAEGIYESRFLTFRYNIVRFWEESAEEYLKEKSLYPFIALTKGGKSVLEEAERRLYEDTDISIDKKADLLTAMAILTGLKDAELARRIIERRRDIMIRSAAYEIIKEEGIREGMREGIKEGMKEGIKEGIQIGMVEEGRDVVLETVKERFGEVPLDISEFVSQINNKSILRQLLRFAIHSKSLDEFREKMKGLR